MCPKFIKFPFVLAPHEVSRVTAGRIEKGSWHEHCARRSIIDPGISDEVPIPRAVKTPSFIRDPEILVSKENCSFFAGFSFFEEHLMPSPAAAKSNPLVDAYLYRGINQTKTLRDIATGSGFRISTLQAGGFHAD